MIVAALVVAATVQGTVVATAAPVPGATVRLGLHSTVTDENGRYAFFGVANGEHVVEAELSGGPASSRTIVVAGRDVDAGTLSLNLATNCSMTIRTCSDAPPAARWDEAQCLDRQSEEVASLRARFTSSVSIPERIADAGALLLRGAADDAVWNELAKWAAEALRLPGSGNAMNMRLVAWARGEGADRRIAERALHGALYFAAHDPRGRSLALQALQTKDDDLVFGAIAGLIKQHDDAALPMIEKALERSKDREWILGVVDDTSTDAARAMAAKFGPP